MKNEYDNLNIVQQGNEIVKHLFQWNEKQQWNGFLRKTVQQLTWISTLGFLEKKGEKTKPPENEKQIKNNSWVKNNK